MKIGFTSESPLTIAFARAWSEAGHHIIGLESEVVLTGQPSAPTFCGTSDLMNFDQAVRESDLLILDADDEVIEGFASALSRYDEAGAPQLRAGQIVCHTSPNLGREALAGLEARGVFTMAIHPATVFFGEPSDKARLVEAMFAIDAPEELLPVAQALVIELGGEAVVVGPAQREKYAEAIGLATVFVSSLVAQASDLLGEAGISEKRAILGALLRGSIEKVLAEGYPQVDPKDIL